MPNYLRADEKGFVAELGEDQDTQQKWPKPFLIPLASFAKEATGKSELAEKNKEAAVKKELAEKTKEAAVKNELAEKTKEAAEKNELAEKNKEATEKTSSNRL